MDKIPDVIIIFMYICKTNVISIRYKTNSRDIYHWKNTQSKNIILKAQKLVLVWYYNVNMTYSQSQSLNQLNIKTFIHLYSIYIFISQLVFIHNTHILINQWKLKISNIDFFRKNNKENQNSLDIEHNTVINIEQKK